MLSSAEKKYISILVCVFAFWSFLSANADNASKSADIASAAADLKVSLKSGMRTILAGLSERIPASEFGKLPDGLEIIEGKGFRGLKMQCEKLDINVHTWHEDEGLLAQYKKCKAENDNLVAAINGSFYSERGVLGQVIVNSGIPWIKQIPGRLSRCFVCSFRGSKDVQFCYLGETSLKATELLSKYEKEMVWFNGNAMSTLNIEYLLGGGGWILKQRKDAHNEAIDRQYFKFRREDQTSRKTVIAQDSERSLYFLVFEEGFTLHMVAREFVKNKIFEKVQDAIFLDGGSSSCIVLKGKYLVPPLYLVDKARFSCINIVKINFGF